MIESPTKLISLPVGQITVTTETKRNLDYYGAFLKDKTSRSFSVEDILVGCLEKELKDPDFVKFRNENSHLKVSDIAPVKRRRKSDTEEK